MLNAKRWITILAVVAVAVTLYSVWSGLVSAKNLQKIQELTVERDNLIMQKSEIETHVAALTKEKADLEAKVKDDQTQAAEHSAKQQQLERDLAVARESAFTGTQPEEYKTKIALFYPAMAKSDWEVMEVTTPSGRKRNYLKVPLGMADTFMFQQTRADNLQSQTQELKSVVDLQTDIIGLQRRITTVTEEKAAAYKEGYDAAYTAYQSANKDLIALLKQPRFQVPKAGALIACSLLGVALGAGL